MIYKPETESVLDQGREPLDWAGLLRTFLLASSWSLLDSWRTRESLLLPPARPCPRQEPSLGPLRAEYVTFTDIWERRSRVRVLGPLPALPSAEWYHQINRVWSVLLFWKFCHIPQHCSFETKTEILFFICQDIKMPKLYLVPLSNDEYNCEWPGCVHLLCWERGGWGVASETMETGGCQGKMRRWKYYVWSEGWKTQTAVGLCNACVSRSSNV